MDKKIQIQIRNAENTAFDNIFPEIDLNLGEYDVRIPVVGDSIMMTIETGTTPTVAGFVDVITETFKNPQGTTFKTVKTITFLDNISGEYTIIEMIDIVDGPSYEIFGITSNNVSGYKIINQTVQAYGTWETQHPITFYEEAE